MKIRMLADISGTRNGEDWPRRGQTIEVGDQEGADLCAAGVAVPVVEDKTETAVVDDAEKRAPARKPSK